MWGSERSWDCFLSEPVLAGDGCPGHIPLPARSHAWHCTCCRDGSASLGCLLPALGPELPWQGLELLPSLCFAVIPRMLCELLAVPPDGSAPCSRSAAQPCRSPCTVPPLSSLCPCPPEQWENIQVLLSKPGMSL